MNFGDNDPRMDETKSFKLLTYFGKPVVNSSNGSTTTLSKHTNKAEEPGPKRKSKSRRMDPSKLTPD